ncbi:MAG: hypothetical protein RLZZ28_932 [Bacteroidota bacterium]|jgi:hypothetical protein
MKLFKHIILSFLTFLGVIYFALLLCIAVFNSNNTILASIIALLLSLAISVYMWYKSTYIFTNPFLAVFFGGILGTAIVVLGFSLLSFIESGFKADSLATGIVVLPFIFPVLAIIGIPAGFIGGLIYWIVGKRKQRQQ